MITKLLVANRGEIARRIMRTAHAMGITCVAVCSDADAGAPHVADADEVVRLAGNSPAETYLCADLLVAAARRSGADAVHPGYGFLSEDAAFARACIAAGLTFVGPPPEVIEAMGSKLAAKATMAGAGVPVLPTVRIPHGTGEGEQAAGGVVEGSLDEGGPIEHNLVESDLIRAATELGFPVLVKASAGGGGRGMRVVEQPDELAEAVSSAAREAHSAFGDGTVFLEPYITRPRHIEVQILGDTHGTVVHLFERECSIQRRHQKIIEESPSPAVDGELRSQLGEAALAVSAAAGYEGAGTVEFLLDADGGWWFLELNARLQVEHP
ncbi:MAG TPA: biotin carboxylase N-terminal domain-containing protein, partial [Acidimicrobiales bacterium]